MIYSRTNRIEEVANSIDERWRIYDLDTALLKKRPVRAPRVAHTPPITPETIAKIKGFRPPNKLPIRLDRMESL